MLRHFRWLLVGIFLGFGLSTTFQIIGQSLSALTTLSEEVAFQDVSRSSLNPEQPELKYLSEMIAKTNGFYARDYSLWLGWNNIRYIIETAVLHGRLLNRTTIIPSFVYARACEFDLATCAAYATMVNRGNATHHDEWNDLPIEEQMAWRIPISIMFNLTHLQKSHAVITTSDYLRLHDIPTDVESSDGHWDTVTYHVQEGMGPMSPSVHFIHNMYYDPSTIVRVDRIPDDMRLRGGWEEEGGNTVHGQPGSWTKSSTDSAIYRALMRALPRSSKRPILDWETARRIVEDGKRITSSSSAEEVGDVLRENGFEVLHTYDGVGGFDEVKHVISLIYMTASRHLIRGLYEDFHSSLTRVLLLTGEIHCDGRKPGSLYFTSPSSRRQFSQMVLYDMRPNDNVLALAERINERIFALTSGRLWVAAHMRRGDYTRIGWALEDDFAAHFARIKQHLEAGREMLQSMHGGIPRMYDVPGAHPDPSVVTLHPPNPDDKYYIATDERDPANLQYLRDKGVVLIKDLLTEEDHWQFGWPILFTDVLGLVEQSAMSHAAYFYAAAMSSLAGGVMNLRAGLGKDPRTALLEI